MRAADYIVDIGPGAGAHGGELVCAGTVDDIIACENLLRDNISAEQENSCSTNTQKRQWKIY